MLTITALSAHGSSSKNGAPVLAYLKATEYYRDKEGNSVSSSRWLGKGAAALGLTGTVDEKAMDALAKGFAPDDGRALCQNAGQEAKWVVQTNPDGTPKLDAKGKERGRWEGGHRVGYDLTFSAEKSFSVVYAAASPEERDRLLSAHHTAVEDALAYLERRAETRRGKAGKDVIGVKGLVASAHTHFGSRDLDPQIHTHTLVYGVAQGADGGWSTWDPQEVYRQKMTAGALYRASLAKNLQGLGYGVERRPEIDADGQETGQIYFRIAGVSDDLCNHFSKRRAAIVEHMAKHGGTAQAACLATRKSKDEPTYAELTQTWAATLEHMRNEDPTLFRDTRDLLGRPSVVASIDEGQLLEKLHETEAVFTRGQLIERLALEHVGQLSARQIEKEADAFLARAEIAPVAAEPIHVDDRGRTLARRHTEDRYAASWILELEQSIGDRALARKDDLGARVARSVVDEAVKAYEQDRGFTLSAEQRKAVDWITQDTGGLAAISGHAGTGKTATAGAWIGAFQADGRKVLGAAVGWDAAKKLEAESGIQSFSTRSLIGQLDRGTIQLSPKAVILLDEAGMAGTRVVSRLQEHCDRVGAKLVLQGDSLQLQAIDAGSPFRLATAVVGERTLTEIRRQKNAGDRQTAEAFYAADGSLRSRAENQRLGQGVLHRLQKAGQIEAYGSQQEALEGLVAEHLKSPTPDREKLVIGGTRTDVQGLNRAIRDGMKKAGRLGIEEHLIQSRDRGTLTDLPLSIGDRVRFGKKDRDMAVINGNVGSIERFERSPAGKLRVVVRLESDSKADEGRKVTVEPSTYAQLTHAYASTVHKAQGQGKTEVRQLANLGMTDRQLSLVAFTRTKQSFSLYGADNDVDPQVLAERMGTDRLKTNALEAKRARGAPAVVNAQTLEAQAQKDRSLFTRAAEVWQRVVERFRGQSQTPQQGLAKAPKIKMGMG